MHPTPQNNPEPNQNPQTPSLSQQPTQSIPQQPAPINNQQTSEPAALPVEATHNYQPTTPVSTNYSPENTVQATQQNQPIQATEQQGLMASADPYSSIPTMQGDNATPATQQYSPTNVASPDTTTPVLNSAINQYNQPPSNNSNQTPGIDGSTMATTDNAKQQPPLVTLAAQLTFRGNDETDAPKTPLMKVVGIVVIIVTILLSGGSIFAARHVQSTRVAIKQKADPYTAKRESDIKKAIKDSGPATQKLVNGKLDVDKLFDATLGNHEQNIKADYNEQINMSNGISFAITSVERNWETGDDYTKPGAGHEFIKIGITVGYRGQSGTGSFSSYTAKLRNSKNGLQDNKYISDKLLPKNNLSSASSINPGDQFSGWIVYEVNKGESPLVLVYEASFYDKESNQKTMQASVDIK